MHFIVSKIRQGFRHDRDFHLLILSGIFAGISVGIYNTVFNNYLSDVYQLDEMQRGIVEFPRELPGMLIVFVLAFLAFLGDVRIAALGMLAAALGTIGLGVLAPSYTLMLVWMMLFSLGTHATMPLIPSIGMHLSKKGEYGKRLGLYSAGTLFATLLGYLLVWIGFKYFAMQYNVAFLLSAIFFCCCAFTFFRMKNYKPENRKVRFVFKRKYILYYLLSLANGGRKQIFLTFAPWVLITRFHLDPTHFAVLGMMIAGVSILTRTLVGRAIDKLGERFVLSTEAVFLFVICFGYIFSQAWFAPDVAVVIMSACYVIDGSMIVVEMARSTYVKKISSHHGEVTPTLSLGVSIDHIFSMSIPFLGGLLWAKTGAYQSVFIAAAIIACINFLLSLRIHIPTKELA